MEHVSAPMAVVAGLVGGLVFGIAGGPSRVAARDADATIPAAAAAASTTRAGCPVVSASPHVGTAPNVPPTGPADRQMDRDGMNRAGGVGTMPNLAVDDPCAPSRVMRRIDRTSPSPAPAASSLGNVAPAGR